MLPCAALPPPALRVLLLRVLPLLLPVAWAWLLLRDGRVAHAFIVGLIALSFWIAGAVYAALHPAG